VNITAPGKYILTRPLVATGPGSVISVAVIGPAGRTEVDIDLNGFTLDGSPNPMTPVINVISAAGSNAEVSIRNGAMHGGANGIFATSGAGTLRKVVIERVRVGNTGSHAISITGAQNAVVRDSILVDAVGPSAGIAILLGLAPGVSAQASIEDNLVRNAGTGIVVVGGGFVTVEIRNNRVELISGAGFGDGIQLLGCLGSLVIENTIQNASPNGIRLIATDGTKLINNVIFRANGGNGIFLNAASDDNLILENVVTQASFWGLEVEGDRNHIEGNLLNTNGRGLTLDLPAGAMNNLYRRNTARGNTGAALCPAAICSADFCGFAVGINHSQADNWLPAIAGAPPACEK
jgi:parallel beta-helix repeat protein